METCPALPGWKLISSIIVGWNLSRLDGLKFHPSKTRSYNHHLRAVLQKTVSKICFSLKEKIYKGVFFKLHYIYILLWIFWNLPEQLRVVKPLTIIVPLYATKVHHPGMDKFLSRRPIFLIFFDFLIACPIGHAKIWVVKTKVHVWSRPRRYNWIFVTYYLFSIFN